MPLQIENYLQKIEQSSGTKYFSKYQVVKDYVFGNHYNYWGLGFPGGNDHGKPHIERVLEHLNNLLGMDSLTVLDSINDYELYLVMMAILFHDIGIVKQRENHAQISKSIFENSGNSYILNDLDKEIIAVAVVCHSSSKNIEQECMSFSSEETIGNQRVRPRLVAALVRLADEIDEDSRRTPVAVQHDANIPSTSEFFWRFGQRIAGVQANKTRKEIIFNIQFKQEDISHSVMLGNEQKPFVPAFIEKISKINKERAHVSQFLLDTLKYESLVLKVRPLANHPTWQVPRTFTFHNNTQPSEFLAAFPELDFPS